MFDSAGSPDGDWLIQRLDDPEMESAGISFFSAGIAMPTGGLMG
uniref:Uncharacterized protein n=1 Tax=Pseudomonas fluorescens (strain SBW25) TaxID=216595 RepID=A0A0G4E4T8_PSEFS|nr:hypothetical protein [Pseudomonas fluorescens]CEK42189.1 hypothetical protein PQBR57_0236 [Pseudomonas fluorescens SBW25]